MKVGQLIEILQRYDKDQDIDINSTEHEEDEKNRIIIAIEEQNKVIIQDENITNIVWKYKGDLDEINSSIYEEYLSKEQREIVKQKAYHVRKFNRDSDKKFAKEVSDKYLQGYEVRYDRNGWWTWSNDRNGEHTVIKPFRGNMNVIEFKSSLMGGEINIVQDYIECFTMYKEDDNITYFELDDKENFLDKFLKMIDDEEACDPPIPLN